MMRFLIAAVLVLSCSLCLAEDFPEDTNRIKSLTAEQAADLAAKFEGDLSLNGLTSIDKDIAQELAKLKGWLYLNGLTSIDKDIAQELAKFEGWLFLDGLTSIDKDVLKILKSNPKIGLPEKYRD
jgi:ABC-type amino acid transport substrate-binding protein